MECAGLFISAAMTFLISLFPQLFLHASSTHLHLLPAKMVNSLWFKWKSLRLPWRKMRVVGESSYCCRRFMRLDSSTFADQLPGQDLAGNTFWVFKDVANANRLRRIVKFDPRTHYDEVQVTRESHRLRGMCAGLATADCIFIKGIPC
jgi:hypothetical protein